MNEMLQADEWQMGNVGASVPCMGSSTHVENYVTA